ncbi:hypothetical protein [Halioxenophilus sp. WMMB6]|uniref:energy transducer TonB n=1 Tax=Halioxenophilus sp. WMMB6 TaxID=3073815 RepID=UPI00295F2BB5|nr:hypothetical protein [Halioxenophilus sp. WMMB6]
MNKFPLPIQLPSTRFFQFTGLLALLLCTGLGSSTGYTASLSTNDDVYDEISRIESEQGAYGAELSEHLMALATNYQEHGRHEDAVEAYKRAIHVQRINEGLYNLNQVPMIEHLIDSQIAMGDWEEATKRYAHLFWLHQRNFGADDPRMLPVLDKLSYWHLNAFSLGQSAMANHLMSAYQMFSMSVDIIHDNYGENDLKMIKPLKGLAISNYYLATLKAQESRNSAAMTMRTNQEMEAERKARLDHYILNSYYNGKQAIVQMIDIYEAAPEANPADLAAARVQLGDWYMLFDRTNAAMDEYLQAYSQLQSNEKLVDIGTTLFATPKALPDLPTLETEAHDNNRPHDYVVVKFDVTARGTTRNIDILEAGPNDSVGNRAMVRRNLKIAKFRPRLENGEAVDTVGIVHRYIIPKS